MKNSSTTGQPTTVEASKRGPLLKSRLAEDAYMCRSSTFSRAQPMCTCTGFSASSIIEETIQSSSFSSKFDIPLQRLKAACMDMMPRYTAQSPEFRTSAQEANHRTIAQHQQGAGARAPPPTLLAEDDPEVQKQAFPFGDNLIAQFVVIRSGLSDQQRERLISAMSLKNITLDKITRWRRSTTTSSSRRSIHPTSRRQRRLGWG